MYNYLKGNVKVFIFIGGIQSFLHFSQGYLKWIYFYKDVFWMSSVPHKTACPESCLTVNFIAQPNVRRNLSSSVCDADCPHLERTAKI